MIFGADFYPTADWYSSQEDISRATLRLSQIGVTSLRWNLANEIGLVGPDRTQEVYDNVARVSLAMRSRSFKWIIGLDVTDFERSLDVVRTLPHNKIICLELHNEPAFKDWHVPDYYERCMELINRLGQVDLPYCLQYHSLADKEFYEDGSVVMNNVLEECAYISPHSYGLFGSFKGYRKFNKPLLITEWLPYGSTEKAENAIDWDWLRALRVWWKMRRMLKDPLVKGIWFHHASRYLFWESGPLMNPKMVRRNRSCNMHRRFAMSV